MKVITTRGSVYSCLLVPQPDYSVSRYRLVYVRLACHRLGDDTVKIIVSMTTMTYVSRVIVSVMTP